MRYTKGYSAQSGVVSLFTVLFFTILISILIIGFIEITNTEQGESAENNFSGSSYYAAQDGLQDTKLALEQYYPGSVASLNANTCTPPSGYSNSIAPASSGLQIGYSCKLINLNPIPINMTLNDNTSTQTALVPESGTYNTIQISWHQLATDGSDIDFRNPAATSLPTYATWAAGKYPAMVRVQIFGYPQGGNFTTADLTSHNYVGFLNPATGNTYNPITLADLNAGLPASVQCYNATPPASYDNYACQADINVGTLPTTYNLFVRLRSEYAPNGTHASVEMLDSGTPVNTANTIADVDVTGYAGDVFSRLYAQVTLPTAQNTSLVPEYALESGQGICKYLELTGTSEVSDGGCTVR